jgi:hypothetical protein
MASEKIIVGLQSTADGRGAELPNAVAFCRWKCSQPPGCGIDGQSDGMRLLSGRLVSSPSLIRPRNRICFAIEPILLHSESAPAGLHALVTAKCRVVRGSFGELCAILGIFQETIRLLQSTL